MTQTVIEPAPLEAVPITVTHYLVRFTVDDRTRSILEMLSRPSAFDQLRRQTLPDDVG